MLKTWIPNCWPRNCFPSFKKLIGMINAIFLNSWRSSWINSLGRIEEETQLATLHWEAMGGFECGSGISEYFSNLLLVFSNATISGVHIDQPQKEKIPNEQLWCGRSGVTGAEMTTDLNLRSAEELWTHTNLEPLLTRWPPTWLLGALEVFVYLPSLLCRCFSCTRGRWGTGAYPSSPGEGRLHPAQVTCPSQRRTVHTPPIRAN